METLGKLSSSIEYYKHALQLLKEITTSFAYTDVAGVAVEEAGVAEEDTDTAGGVPISYPKTRLQVVWSGVAMVVSGSTNANILKAKTISIWDGNASREFLDKYAKDS
jgi:hypothetical protein